MLSLEHDPHMTATWPEHDRDMTDTCKNVTERWFLHHWDMTGTWLEHGWDMAQTWMNLTTVHAEKPDRDITLTWSGHAEASVTWPWHDPNVTTTPSHDQKKLETWPGNAPKHDRFMTMTGTSPGQEWDRMAWGFAHWMPGGLPYPCKTASLSLLGNKIIRIYIYIYSIKLHRVELAWLRFDRVRLDFEQGVTLVDLHLSNLISTSTDRIG